MNGWRERAKKQREKESTRCERKIEATEGCVKRKTYELTSIQDKITQEPGRERKILCFFHQTFLHPFVYACVFICVCLHGIKAQREDEGGKEDHVFNVDKEGR